MSVFVGGWDVEAAEFVCHGGPLDAEEILALLASLTEKSIVTHEGDTAAVRYRMLDTVRSFGAEWLAGLGEEEAVRLRHRDYFRWISRQGEAEWLGPGRRMWAEPLTAEHANLRLAVEECIAAPEPETALDLAGALWNFWFACGFAGDGRGYLERALRRGRAGGPAHTLAIWTHRLVTVVPDDLDAAESVSAAYVWLAEERRLPVPALPLTGASMAVRGESARSAVLYGNTPRGPGGGGGAEFFQLLTLAVQAYLLAGQGAFERCAAVAERLRADCAKRGELWMRAWGDFFVSLSGMGLGRPDEALRTGRAAPAAEWRMNDRLGTAAVADPLVAGAACQGEPELAARLLGVSRRLWYAAGLPRLGHFRDDRLPPRVRTPVARGPRRHPLLPSRARGPRVGAGRGGWRRPWAARDTRSREVTAPCAAPGACVTGRSAPVRFCHREPGRHVALGVAGRVAHSGDPGTMA